MPELNYITYLSPGIPEEFFRRVIEGVNEYTGISGSLLVESGVSGPPRGADDPFTSGEVDVGFMCAPPYLWLREPDPAPVELLGVAPVPVDSRCSGRPVYFSDVVVRAEDGIGSFAELRGKVWAYNDACSLSGFYGMISHLRDVSEGRDFFGDAICSGSHARSLDLLLAGEVDVISVDSNALRRWLREEPELRNKLRTVASLGPFPIQPVVVRRDLSESLKAGLRAAFLDLDLLSDDLSDFGFERFAEVTEDHYDEEREILKNLTPSRTPPGIRDRRGECHPVDMGSG